MSDSRYRIRSFRPEDFNGCLRLNVEAENQDGTGRFLSVSALGEHLNRPNYLPGIYSFVAEEDGRIVGYAEVTPELGIERVIVDCLVHPGHRRKGLATELSLALLARTRELRARLVHANVAEENTAARGLLDKLRFKIVRRYLEMVLQLPVTLGTDADRIAGLCRHLRHGEEGRLTQVQNRAFAGSWGFAPNSVEETVYRLSLSHTSPTDVILAIEGDQAIGYCWTDVNPEADARGSRRGRICMLGVVPEHRGRGVGRLLLMAGLAHLEGRGVDIVDLTVDSQNISACAIYEAVGFEVSSTSLWYERELH